MSENGPDSQADANLNYKSANVAQGVEPSYKSPAAWVRFALPAVVGFGLDLWSKAYTFPDGVTRMATGELAYPQGRYPKPQGLIPKVLVLHTTSNEGAVFGIGQGKVKFFLLFSILALAMITWVFATSRRSQRWLHIALGLITAGALGNLYDRAAFGAVRDFLRFTVWWYPFIFNVADVLLCIGVPLLMLCWMFAKDPVGKKVGKLAE